MKVFLLNQRTEIQRRKKENLPDLILIVPWFSDVGTERKISTYNCEKYTDRQCKGVGRSP